MRHGSLEYVAVDATMGGKGRLGSGIDQVLEVGRQASRVGSVDNGRIANGDRLLRQTLLRTAYLWVV